MDAVTSDVASALGLLTTLYATVVLIRRIFLQRTAWIAAEADTVVAGELFDRYDDVLDRFAEGGAASLSPDVRVARDAPRDGSRDDGGLDDDDDGDDGVPAPPHRAASRCALLCVPPPPPPPPASGGTAESEGMQLAPGRSPARVDRWRLPPDSAAPLPPTELASAVRGAGGPRPSCCDAPAIGTASFDEHPFDAAWAGALRRNVLRFVGVAGRPLLGVTARDALVEAAAVALRSRLPLCPHAEALQHATAAFCRAERCVGGRLCTDYFRFCAVATRVAG
jgi:hypothetical protein